MAKHCRCDPATDTVQEVQVHLLHIGKEDDHPSQWQRARRRRSVARRSQKSCRRSEESGNNLRSRPGTARVIRYGTATGHVLAWWSSTRFICRKRCSWFQRVWPLGIETLFVRPQPMFEKAIYWCGAAILMFFGLVSCWDIAGKSQDWIVAYRLRLSGRAVREVGETCEQ